MSKPFKRPQTCEEMRAHAQELRARADRLMSGAWDRFPPSSAVTGGSKWRSTFGRAHDRAMRGFENAGAKAKQLRESAEKWAMRANRIDPVWLAEEQRSAEKKKALRATERQAEQAERKAATLVNNPSAPCHMTSAEWSRLHRDYKTISVEGANKVRRAIHNGGLCDVYLTDKPAKLPASPAE